MRMTFSTPVTPTRERLTCVAGRRAWTSLPSRAGRVAMAASTIAVRRHPPSAELFVHWPRLGAAGIPVAQPLAVSTADSYNLGATGRAGSARPAPPEEQGLTDKEEGVALLATEGPEAPFLEIEELRAIAG